MIKFTWQYTESRRTKKSYIIWEATWDGRWDNDELLTEEELNNDPYTSFHHPFEQTVDFEQAKSIYDYQKSLSEEEKRKRFVLNVIQDDGSVKEEDFGPAGVEDVEQHNPKNLKTCGDTVAVNSVTRALCDLLSDPEKIKLASGNTHPYAYRSNLFGCLSRLWD